MQTERFTLKVDEGDRGKRLDLYLAEHLTSTSRSQIQRYIRAGQILLNGAKAKVGAKLKGGDLVAGWLPEPIPPVPVPEQLPLTILYQDRDIAVVDKPAGMMVHPAGGVRSGTLVNALLFYVRDLGGVGGVLRPGIVHRLDKGTSGVMVVAKNDQAHEALVSQFKERVVMKRYLALVHGIMKDDKGVIRAPIGRHPKDRIRISLRTKRPKEAESHWRVMERFAGFTLVEVTPRTGRTHQIRVHLSSIGHPIVGDPIYTKKSRLNEINDHVVRGAIRALGRQALHACYLSFHHPRTGVLMEFSSPLAADIERVLEVLRGRGV